MSESIMQPTIIKSLMLISILLAIPLVQAETTKHSISKKEQCRLNIPARDSMSLNSASEQYWEIKVYLLRCELGIPTPTEISFNSWSEQYWMLREEALRRGYLVEDELSKD